MSDLFVPEVMSPFALDVMNHKYAHDKKDGTKESWKEISQRVAKNVMRAVDAPKSLVDEVAKRIESRQFMPGGRYLYAAGRPYHQVQNCLLMRAEDSREGWAQLMHNISMGLMSGAGIGIDYSRIRSEGKPIRKTGGTATGPLALMQMVNETGRGIRQGGSRRCLPDETKVTMADYTTKRIADIRVGDLVMTRFGARRVSNVFDQGIQDIVEICTEYGNVRSTRNHRWLFANGARTKSFYGTTAGLSLKCKLYYMPTPIPGGESGEMPSRITDIRSIGKMHTFDIEVEDVHEFIADGFISHNSAIWAGLNWQHADIHKFITMKNWPKELRELKEQDYNFPLMLDGTNISVQLDDTFFEAYANEKHPLHSQARQVYWAVIERMVKTGEPGFSVDTGKNAKETLRNACCEVTSADDSDICNLGSINLARIHTVEDFTAVLEVAVAFLMAGTVYSDVPYPLVDQVRNRNRRLGLGLMGIHEWLLLHKKPYGPDSDLQKYMDVYATSSDVAAKYAKQWELSTPIKTRAIAPTGTIGIVAETTTGMEPIFCSAYKRRYLKGSTWHYQYVVDPTAKRLVELGTNPDMIEDAYSLSSSLSNIERRLQFQAWLQQYVDHSISSTINLPAWGTAENNTDTIQAFGNCLMKYLPKLRGITCYPDGARGGQPISAISYKSAVKHLGEIFVESVDVCDITHGGSCGA